MLPTRLPLEEFFEELLALYQSAVPPTKQLALLRKFPLREWPAVYRRSTKIRKRMEAMPQDYSLVA